MNTSHIDTAVIIHTVFSHSYRLSNASFIADSELLSDDCR